MACVLGLYFSVERLRKHRSLDYTPSTSSATGCCLSGSVNYLLVPRRGTRRAHTHWATRLTHHTATPAPEGEESPICPYLSLRLEGYMTAALFTDRS